MTTRTFGTAKLKGNEWVIECEPHVAMRMKRVFKRAGRSSAGRIILSHTPEIAADLEWFSIRYPLRFEPEEVLRATADRHRETILRLEEYLGDGYQPRPFPMLLPPRSYQAREAEVVLARNYLLIADEVGLGKTVSAIAVISDERARPAVVVCPTHLPHQWAEEVRKFLPKARVHIVKKGTPYPIATGLFGPPDVVIINYAKLSGWASVLGAMAKTVVFDEAQALRRATSDRYQAAKQIAAGATFRMGLSATPIYNYGGEIFNVFEVIAPGILGSREEFVEEWCTFQGNGNHGIKDPKAFGTWARENFAMIRHTRADVGRELPDVLKIVQTVDSDTAALESVENRAKELATILLRRGETHRGAKMNAAEELSNALRQATGIAKAPYVAEFVRLLVESGEKVVLCGWHRAVYDIWRDKLWDLKVVYFTGSETAHEKEVSKYRFTKGDANVLFLSLRSGEGLNDLQLASSCIVFGELDWSPAVHEQAIGRLQRDGQKNKVVAYFLIAEEGADPAMVEVLGIKRAQVDGIVDPYGSLVEKLETSGDRIRQLAESYLRKHGIRVEDLEPVQEEESA